MSNVWVPGAAGPHQEFIARLQRQVETFASERGLAKAVVEVELRDGSRYTLEALSPEPGYGFVTITPQPEEDVPAQVIVQIGAIGRIDLFTEDDKPGKFGFSVREPTA
jgi:hypothetical protein